MEACDLRRQDNLINFARVSVRAEDMLQQLEAEKFTCISGRT
jgi:hypothetical protein